MSKKKELSFFDLDIRWRMGIDWYKSHFNASYPINGESSPQYARYPRTGGVPERIKSVLGRPKLIYAIRDPVERILSDYVQNVESRGSAPERRPFKQILNTIEEEKHQYIECSSYFLQISQFLKVFPRESMHIVILERLQSNPASVLREVFKFLDVNPDFCSEEFGSVFNSGECKRRPGKWFERGAPLALQQQLWRPTWMPWKLSRALHEVARIGGAKIEKPNLSASDDLRLQEFLRPDVEKLRAFVGDPLTEWRPYR
jgi:Sulfotransferase domain